MSFNALLGQTRLVERGCIYMLKMAVDAKGDRYPAAWTGRNGGIEYPLSNRFEVREEVIRKRHNGPTTLNMPSVDSVV